MSRSRSSRARISPKKVDIGAALKQAEALEKAHNLGPSWDDYIAEGVVTHRPEPGERAHIEGHERVVRALQMNERRNLAKADVAAEIAATIPRVKIKAQGGLARMVPEHRAERVERKYHVPKCMITVPDGPWRKR